MKIGLLNNKLLFTIMTLISFLFSSCKNEDTNEQLLSGLWKLETVKIGRAHV